MFNGGDEEVQEEKLRAGIAARYPGIDPELLEHVVTAKLTLMDRGYSEAKLLDLQGEMAGGDDLDTVLSRAETAQDFGPRQVVDKLLDRDSFQGILRSKSQIFDLGTPSDHGPHTHRMQWYVLYKAFQEGRLKKKPVELYEALGGGELQDSKDEIRTLWDDVFDFDNAAAGLIGGGEEDEARERAAYSSPEWMLNHLARADGPLQGGRLQQQLAGDRQIMRQLGGGALQDMKGALVQKIFWKEMARGLPENEAAGRLAILEDLDVPALKEIFKGLGGVLP
jgi:hypothetical protein